MHTPSAFIQRHIDHLKVLAEFLHEEIEGRPRSTLAEPDAQLCAESQLTLNELLSKLEAARRVMLDRENDELLRRSAHLICEDCED